MQHWIGKHPVFKTGPEVLGNILWSEFQACMKMGLDIDQYFQKDRNSRITITGGAVADGAISSMRQFDMAKEREAEAEAKARRKK